MKIMEIVAIKKIKSTLLSKFNYNKQLEDMKNVKSIYYIGKTHYLYIIMMI